MEIDLGSLLHALPQMRRQSNLSLECGWQAVSSRRSEGVAGEMGLATTEWPWPVQVGKEVRIRLESEGP